MKLYLTNAVSFFHKTIVSESITSKSVVCAQRKIERTVTAIFKYSMEAQLFDYHLASHEKTLQERILTGEALLPEIKPSEATPYSGSCQQLIDLISHTIHATLGELDLNGVGTCLDFIHQVEAGKELQQIQIDALRDYPEVTCVGISYALIQTLKEKHGVEGSLAALREKRTGTLKHAAVIVECSDGYILIESTNSPVPMYIPFEQEREFYNCRFIASKPGSPTPLTVFPLPISDQRNSVSEFCTNISNAGDLLGKSYMAICLQPSHAVVAGIYGRDRTRLRRVILTDINQRHIVLKDMETQDERRTATYSFQAALKGELYPHLSKFMEPQYPLSLPGYHITAERLQKQILEFISKAGRIFSFFQQNSE